MWRSANGPGDAEADAGGEDERAELDSGVTAEEPGACRHQRGDAEQAERERRGDDLDGAKHSRDDQPDNPRTHRGAPKAE